MIYALLALLVVLWLVRRARRRVTLAGLDQDRPQFTLTPPTRWTTRGKDHRL